MQLRSDQLHKRGQQHYPLPSVLLLHPSASKAASFYHTLAMDVLLVQLNWRDSLGLLHAESKHVFRALELEREHGWRYTPRVGKRKSGCFFDIRCHENPQR